ncbi:MAG TPA: NAD(P)H-hydrate dehydratase [Actinomycetota bacterium]
MKPVLTPLEASELDRETQARGVPDSQLMERAGRAVADAATELAGGVYGRRAVVVCGTGNNGGDGFVAARLLSRAGMRVDVFCTDPAGIGGSASKLNADRLAEQALDVRMATSLGRSLARADVVVDAIFGTGFHGAAEDRWAESIVELNAAQAPIVAVDIPSGVDGATGAVPGEGVRATITVTFGAAKLGIVLLPGAEHAGTIRVVDIGLLEPAPAMGLTEPHDVAASLPVRGAQAHKRRSGTLLVVAGSRSMTGAPVLIARAAGRIGAGLVTVATPRDAASVVGVGTIEAVFLPLEQTDRGTVSWEAIDDLLEASDNADAVAIGPGMSRHVETAELIRALVGRISTPVVLDADGLNAYEGRAGELRERAGPTVITPHDGEFARLMGVPVDEAGADRVAAARALGSASGAITLLKGPRTVIAPRDGSARINTTGSAALATAGTGDVLTGVIGGLLARGVDPLEAAIAGAFVHGVAGRMAGAAWGDGALASDVVDQLPAAIRSVTQAEHLP